MNKISFIQDMDEALLVMYSVSRWIQESGLKPSQWWRPENMNRGFLLKHTEPGEYCVAIINGKSAASMVIQTTERNQSWKSVDGNKPKKALYIHWLCVHRDFAGENLPKNMIDFAAKQARRQNIKFLRVDTNAKEVKLREIYEKLGFSLMSIEQEDYRNTAFYQKIV